MRAILKRSLSPQSLLLQPRALQVSFLPCARALWTRQPHYGRNDSSVQSDSHSHGRAKYADDGHDDVVTLVDHPESAQFGALPAGGKGKKPVLPGTFTLLRIEADSAKH